MQRHVKNNLYNAMMKSLTQASHQQLTVGVVSEAQRLLATFALVERPDVRVCSEERGLCRSTSAPATHLAES